MGIMAGKTFSFFGRRVFYFLRQYSITMAGKAEVGRFLKQQIGISARMGTVACCALSLSYGNMFIFFGKTFFIMAHKTEIGRFHHQGKLRSFFCMRCNVTYGTAELNRRMHNFFFFDGIVAVGT